MPETVPPGRAGRLFLIERLAATRRGADLLDRKRQLLRAQLEEFRAQRDVALNDLKAVLATAEIWALRSSVLGGESDLAAAKASLSAKTSVDITWRNSMGVAYPDGFTCSFPELTAGQLAAGNAAMSQCITSYRSALTACVAFAVADHALRRVDEELRSTTRRVRAIEQYRIPALEDSLHRLELRLDELDREERIVTRWAKDQQGTSARL